MLRKKVLLAVVAVIACVSCRGKDSWGPKKKRSSKLETVCATIYGSPSGCWTCTRENDSSVIELSIHEKARDAQWLFLMKPHYKSHYATEYLRDNTQKIVDSKDIEQGRRLQLTNPGDKNSKFQLAFNYHVVEDISTLDVTKEDGKTDTFNCERLLN